MLLMRRIHSERSRRVVGLFTLCALLLGVIGLPMPRRISKDLSQPFPCQQRACGCMDAASCWKSCCCHTNREKIAWAKEHGVKPPEFVVAAAEKEGQTSSKACCVAKAAKSKGCCEAKKATPKTETTFALVTLEDARKCQGQAPLVLLLSQTVAEVREIDFDFRPVFCGTLTPTSIVVDNLTADLPLQPPRMSL